MQLTVKRNTHKYHEGYGAGSGSIDTTVYFCPCNEGEVEEVRDNIPGFRSTDWYLNCSKCEAIYDFNYSTGDFTPKASKDQ